MITEFKCVSFTNCCLEKCFSRYLSLSKIIKLSSLLHQKCWCFTCPFLFIPAHSVMFSSSKNLVNPLPSFCEIRRHLLVPHCRLPLLIRHSRELLRPHCCVRLLLRDLHVAWAQERLVEETNHATADGKCEAHLILQLPTCSSVNFVFPFQVILSLSD
jgi:hypothetical protein